MTPISTATACACGRPIEAAGLERVPAAWACERCREARHALGVPPVQGDLPTGAPCPDCGEPIELVAADRPTDPPLRCPSGHGPWFGYEVRCAHWAVGRTEQGTLDFGERWPVVRRGIEIGLRGAFADLGPLAGAAAAARHVAGWRSQGGR